MDWCQAILFVKNQFEQRIKAAKASCEDKDLWKDENLNCAGVPVFDNFEDIEPRHHVRFQELSELCDKLLRKLDFGEGTYKIFKDKIKSKNEQFEIAEKQRIKFENEMRRIKAE